MKILLPLILFFTFFLLYADESEALTVKYDEKYYSPRGRVEKFDIILPKNSKHKYYFIKIKRVFTLGKSKVLDNFEKIFAINKDGSVYLYLERKNNMADLNMTMRFEEKQNILWGTSVPKCRNLYSYAKKDSNIDYGQETLIANYTNIRENYKSGDYSVCISVSPDNPIKTSNFSFKISLSFIKKPKDSNYISLVENPEIIEKIKLPDLNKLNKGKLIKLRDKIMRARENALEMIIEGKSGFDRRSELLGQYLKVEKALEAYQDKNAAKE